LSDAYGANPALFSREGLVFNGFERRVGTGDDGDMTASALASELGDIERRRLQCLVEPRIEEAEGLHTADFQLVHPGGGVWSRTEYLGGIAEGRIDYRRFKAVSAIEVMVDGDLAVLRYRSLIDIAVAGQPSGPLQCWHLDCYRRDPEAGVWQVRWSQATETGRPQVQRRSLG
jgi:hypothetical protein